MVQGRRPFSSAFSFCLVVVERRRRFSCVGSKVRRRRSSTNDIVARAATETSSFMLDVKLCWDTVAKDIMVNHEKMRTVNKEWQFYWSSYNPGTWITCRLNTSPIYKLAKEMRCSCTKTTIRHVQLLMIKACSKLELPTTKNWPSR